MPSSYKTIELTDGWAKSVLGRMNLVKRKGTKAAHKLPENFLQVKKTFLDLVNESKKTHNIPDDLIVNWDQTGVNMVPQFAYTMAEKGSKQVPLVAIDDKRQITALLAVSMTGKMLAPQILYPGVTERCHPTQGVEFPSDWDIWHSKSHWSTNETMSRYVDKVVLPYLFRVKETLRLPSNQKSICIFDVFAAHRTEDFLAKLKSHDLIPIFVPASCTSELQPLDLSVNMVFKTLMKKKFSNWYSEKIFEGLTQNKGGPVPKVSLNMSIIKSVHATWLIEVLNELGSRKELIRKGFREAGILSGPVDSDPYEADTEPCNSISDISDACQETNSSVSQFRSQPVNPVSNSKVVVTLKSDRLIVKEVLEWIISSVE